MRPCCHHVLRCVHQKSITTKWGPSYNRSSIDKRTQQRPALFDNNPAKNTLKTFESFLPAFSLPALYTLGGNDTPDGLTNCGTTGAGVSPMKPRSVADDVGDHVGDSVPIGAKVSRGMPR